MPQDAHNAKVLLFTAPRAYESGFFSGTVDLLIATPGEVPLIKADSEFVWFSVNPTATGDYGFGFLRRGNIIGGWYDTASMIDTIDMAGLFTGVPELPELPAKWKIISWDDEGKRRVTVTESGMVPASAAATPDELQLLPLIKREITTGLTAPGKDKPFKMLDGTWDYSVDSNGDGLNNTASLTFKLTPKTGIFSGKFVLWFDYISEDDQAKGTQKLAHKSKSVSFQGVMTPNRSSGPAVGCGYFLWPEQGEYDSGRVDKNGNPTMKSYQYKRSLPFEVYEAK